MPVQPCESKFLKALIRDMLVLLNLLSYTALDVDMNFINMDQPLPREYAIIATNLGEVMQHCRRLKACPELFPSPEERSNFLKKVSKVLPIMSIIPNLLATRKEIDTYQIYEVEDPDFPDEERMPHPNTVKDKNVWNQWLDNTAVSTPGWVFIEQKIPRIGDILMKRITLEYDAIEADFVEVR